jgi:CheY-like chemotaxis protein
MTANTTSGRSENNEEAQSRSCHTGKRILVIEDNRDSADILRLLLECYGYQVAVAYTGPDGVKAAEQYQPDMVLCDIGLPGLDGYGVARQLRDNPATAHAVLIAVTAYGRDEDRHRSYEAGFEHHLVKPVDPDVLQRVLNRSGRSETNESHEGTVRKTEY